MAAKYYHDGDGIIRPVPVDVTAEIQAKVDIAAKLIPALASWTSAIHTSDITGCTSCGTNNCCTTRPVCWKCTKALLFQWREINRTPEDAA